MRIPRAVHETDKRRSVVSVSLESATLPFKGVNFRSGRVAFSVEQDHFSFQRRSTSGHQESVWLYNTYHNDERSIPSGTNGPARQAAPARAKASAAAHRRVSALATRGDRATETIIREDSESRKIPAKRELRDGGGMTRECDAEKWLVFRPYDRQ